MKDVWTKKDVIEGPDARMVENRIREQMYENQTEELFDLGIDMSIAWDMGGPLPKTSGGTTGEPVGQNMNADLTMLKKPSTEGLVQDVGVEGPGDHSRNNPY